MTTITIHLQLPCAINACIPLVLHRHRQLRSVLLRHSGIVAPFHSQLLKARLWFAVRYSILLVLQSQTAPGQYREVDGYLLNGLFTVRLPIEETACMLHTALHAALWTNPMGYMTFYIVFAIAIYQLPPPFLGF